MTKQETFDTVVRALLQQGRASRNESGKCRYRGPYGAKCAAGHLIPDELYTLDLEGCVVTLSDATNVLVEAATNDEERAVLERVHRNNQRLREILTSLGHDLELARDLQKAHDRASEAEFFYPATPFVEGFRAQARWIAEQHGLDAAVLS